MNFIRAVKLWGLKVILHKAIVEYSKKNGLQKVSNKITTKPNRRISRMVRNSILKDLVIGRWE